MSDAMKAVATRREGYTHDLEVDGHALVSDEPEEVGGNDRGASPMRLLLASLAACTAITVEMYADRKGWDLGELVVEAETEGPVAGHGERTFTVILRIPHGLSEEQTSRIRTIAGKCPVHRALTGASEITIDDVVVAR
jgi:putative redox protein